MASPPPQLRYAPPPPFSPPSTALTTPRSRSNTKPLLVLAAVGVSASVFIALRWRAVLARSEAAKKATTFEKGVEVGKGDYGVRTGRSGGGV